MEETASLYEVAGQSMQQRKHMVQMESSWVHSRRAVQKRAVEMTLWHYGDCAAAGAGNERYLDTVLALNDWYRAKYLSCWDAGIVEYV